MINNYELDEAQAKLDEIKKMVADVPDDYAGKALLEQDSMCQLLALKRENWLGGRWTGSSETDQMTGQTNASAVLHSIGRVEPVNIVLRCQKGSLDAYDTTCYKRALYQLPSGRWLLLEPIEGTKATPYFVHEHSWLPYTDQEKIRIYRQHLRLISCSAEQAEALLFEHAQRLTG